MNKIFISTLLAAMLPQLAEAAPKNIIYMIGDGMGPAYLSAYRYYQDNPATKAVESTVYDELWVGVASTYPDDETIVTDSAAGATALATRVKSYNGAISVNHQHQPLTTMLEIAKAKGMHTGIVATSQINHATPASFIAHNEHRKNYNEIANDFVDNKVAGKFVADVMFGGGTKYFIRNDRNLVTEFKQAGFSYADNWQDLTKLSKLPALALLAPVGLPSSLDNPVANPLQTMTEKALQLLTPSEKGFVLMVEGSQIDWCGHANDIACAMAEMDDFAKAIRVAKAYVDSHPDTILVITADHETGGLSLGAEGVYAWNTNVIKGVKHTAPEISRLLLGSPANEIPKLWTTLTSIKLTAAEFAELTLALQQAKKVLGAKLPADLEDLPKTQEQALDALSAAVKKQINHYSKTGWTSEAHTAIDVPVLAWGKQRGDFAGFQDNTDIAAKLIGYLDAR
ncbi:alkaline phosphatase [Rheinheimera sp. SA_1]|uniref:alkaline phosphatase n=1 Tax=Rheinheimera sp. SA_1 TaxID=1827365 RepID=UPI000800C9C3|nr:alkaline phosphatase [Rheinheimera sp. SA_1]OBP15513.1 alkaline phosphatase [Rheinheimera sp. SA_1]